MKVVARHQGDLALAAGGWIGVIDSRDRRFGIVALFRTVSHAAAFVEHELPAGILVEVLIPE